MNKLTIVILLLGFLKGFGLLFNYTNNFECCLGILILLLSSFSAIIMNAIIRSGKSIF
jgi:hypothetical protein